MLPVTTCTTMAWAVSQHTGTSKKTKASKCCYALHSFFGTMFNHDRLFARQHPPSSKEINRLIPAAIEVIKNGRPSNPLTLLNAFSVYNCILLVMLRVLFFVVFRIVSIFDILKTLDTFILSFSAGWVIFVFP